MNKEPADKTYCIRKYVKAPSIKVALEKEPQTEVEEIFIDEPKTQASHKADAIGFRSVEADLTYEL